MDNTGLSFHQPGLNIHTTASGTDELLVQGDPGGQVLLSTDGGGSFVPLCSRPDFAQAGSGVGILRDGTTLLAATNLEQFLTKTFVVAQTTVHRAEITRGGDSGDGTSAALDNFSTLQHLDIMVVGACSNRLLVGERNQDRTTICRRFGWRQYRIALFTSRRRDCVLHDHERP